MNVQPMIHLTAAQLSDLALGKLDDAQLESVERHLQECATCRQAATEVPPDSFVNLVRSAKSPVSVSTPTPLPPVTQGLPEIGIGPKGSPADVLPGLPPELAENAKFRILRELGRGGMGVVYQAEHRLMKRPVAIKVLNPRLLDNPGALARFHQEVEAAAQLAHPNIVTSHDAEQAGDLHMLVMEYVEGQSLAQVLERKGPLPIRHACHFVGQAARGLQHAFEKKMIHRDIKPQNLMLTPQGVVKILDFGLARVAERPREKGLTQESVVMGTPEYIAPEQATDARQADIRSDIYSLGCTLYCLLSGRPPFQGETAMQIILSHLEKEAPPLTQLRSEVSPELAVVVAKMMARKPEQRYHTPAEVMAALAPFSKAGRESGTTQAAPWADLGAKSGETMVAKGPPKSRGKRWALAALAVVALALGGWLLAGLIVKVETPEGTIVLDIDQPGAEVLVDDGKITVKVPGDNKPVEIKLEPGKHKLRISKDGFVAVTREIELKTGKSPPIRIRLEPVPGAAAKPAGDALPTTFTNSLGMEFVLVPKGKSWLGGGGGNPGTNKVEIPQDFYLGKYTVTQEEWQKLTKVNPSFFSRTGGGKDKVKDIPDGELKRFPVESVSWDDAQAFIKLLNEKRKEPGWSYRLPTEVEWEYACRGGPLSTPFPSAFDFYFAEPTNVLRPDQANFRDSGLQRTCMVGSYPPNRLGLYDMHGNVCQWCLDEVAPPEPKDPKRALQRVSRGGIWSEVAGFCRAASRDGNVPSRRIGFRGLRLARFPVGKESSQSTLPPPKTEPAPNQVVPPPQKVPATVSVDEAWLKSVAALPTAKQIEAVKAKLRELNPGFDSPMTYHVEGGVVTELKFVTGPVMDITPLRALTGLQSLSCTDGKLEDLSPLRDLKLTTLSCANTKVVDLTPLKDMKLTDLNFRGTQVSDLSPLKNMRLTSLNCDWTRVYDLSPLKGMPLKTLSCGTTPVSDLRPLEGMRLTRLNCPFTPVSDLTPLKDMKLLTLDCTGTKVSDLKPLKDMKLTYLNCDRTQIADLTPLKDMKLLTLNCCQTKVSDLTPLKDMPLNELFFGTTRVSDLSPLHGMPLKNLTCGDTPVSDLSPLRGMPLTWLNCADMPVSDLSPLKDMKLTWLGCGRTQVADLTPLKDMKLRTLGCYETKVTDLSPLHGMPLNELDFHGCGVQDLTPLQGMPLHALSFTPKHITKGIDVIRRMASIKQIGFQGLNRTQRIPAAEFWERYDAGEFSK